MSKTLDLEYILEEQDYVDISFGYYLRYSFTKRIPLFAIWMLLLIGAFILVFGFHDYYFALLAIFMVFASTDVIIECMVLPRRYYRKAGVRPSKKLRISENGINTKSDYKASQINWVYFGKVWEVDKGYILFNKQDVPDLMLPKRVFNPEQEQILRALLIEKLNFKPK